MSVTLYLEPNGSVFETFGDSEMDLKTKAEFKQAVVTSGTWIFYTYSNYNGAQPGASASNYKVLRPGDQVDIRTVNGSMYLVYDATEGFILFEHSFYGGQRKSDTGMKSLSDVNAIFPSGKIGGVSSAIILSQNQNFSIYSQVNYEGLTGLLKAGEWYPTPNDMGFPNDSLQSIRKK
ncbi:uncharacterized protein LOC144654629 [Oculina patagonica]